MKHKEAVIVSLAYVIGFTTAFIAFAINDGSSSDGFSRNHRVEKSEVKHDYKDHGVRAVTTDEGLFVVIKGEKTLISRYSEESEKENAVGHHVSVPIATVSLDGKFVHYCAEVVEGEACMNFVYSLEDASIHPIRNGEDPLVLTEAEARTAVWHADGNLSIANTVSAAPNTPWLMR